MFVLRESFKQHYSCEIKYRDYNCNGFAPYSTTTYYCRKAPDHDMRFIDIVECANKCRNPLTSEILNRDLYRPTLHVIRRSFRQNITDPTNCLNPVKRTIDIPFACTCEKYVPEEFRRRNRPRSGRAGISILRRCKKAKDAEING